MDARQKLLFTMLLDCLCSQHCSAGQMSVRCAISIPSAEGNAVGHDACADSF